MQKVIQFNVNEDIAIKKETVSGVLLNIKPYQVDGTTVCVIADLNKIAFDVILERQGREPIYLLQGYLEDILVGLYSQTTKFDINKTKLSDGYKVMIDFSPSVIVLSGNDTLRIRTKFQNTAFTSLSTANSSVTIESIPAFGGQTLVPQLREYAIAAGDVLVDREVGDNVIKITMLTDVSAAYLASTEAKPESVDIYAKGYAKSVSGALVEAENIHYLDFNPDTPIQDLVLYTGSRIDDVRVKSKLNKAAITGAKLLVVSAINA